MRLSWRDIAVLTFFPCFIAMGQVLFKLTAAHGKGLPLASAAAAFAAQPVFSGALAVYVVGTVMWLWILSRYPLSLAYPFASIALVAVPLLEVLFFHVRTTTPYWAGLALIVSGVLLVTRSRISDAEADPR